MQPHNSIYTHFKFIQFLLLLLMPYFYIQRWVVIHSCVHYKSIGVRTLDMIDQSKFMNIYYIVFLEIYTSVKVKNLYF